MGHRLNGNGKTLVSVVRCEGNLDATKMVTIKNRLSRLFNQNHKFLLLDLARARRIDVTGLGILMDRIQRFRALDGDVRLFNLKPAVFEMLRRVGVDELVETYPTEEEARRSFQIA